MSTMSCTNPGTNEGRIHSKFLLPTGQPTWEKLYISVAHLVYCFLPIRLTNAAGARSAHRECFLRNLLKNYQMCLIDHPLVLCRSSKSWKQFLWVDRGWCSLCMRTVRSTNNHLHTYIQPTHRMPMHQPMHWSVQNSCKVSSSSHYILVVPNYRQGTYITSNGCCEVTKKNFTHNHGSPQSL